MRIRHVSIGVIFFLFLPLVIAYTPFLQDAVDSSHRPYVPLSASYASTPPLSYIVPTTSSFFLSQVQDAPLVGNVDDDRDIEVFYAYNARYTGFAFDGGLTIEYTDLGSSPVVIPRDQNGLLYDVDDDGREELFFCGTQGANETVIVGVDWINNTPSEMWRIVVGGIGFNNICHMQDDTGSNLNHTYKPTAHTIDGVPTLFFFTANASQNYRGVDVWKIVGSNGSYTSHNYFTTTGCTNGLIAPGTHNSFTPRPWRSNDATKNGLSPHVSTAICQSGAYTTMYIPHECVVTSPTLSRGLLAVDIRTMQRLPGFGTNGYSSVENTAGQLTSPSCWSSSSIVIGTDINEMKIYQSTESGMVSLDDVDASGANHIWVSDMFQGEFDDPDDPLYDSLCFAAVQNTSDTLNVYCTQGIPDFPFSDEVYVYYAGGAINGYIGNTWMSTTPSNQYYRHDAEDIYQDIITPIGLFSSDPTLSGYVDDSGSDLLQDLLSTEDFRDSHLYGYMQGECIGLDIDNDGYGDILCTSPTNITILYSGQTNQPVNLKKVGIDVSGTMCVGNQSFFINYESSAGYEDPEGDRVRTVLDCENNGTVVYSNYTSYGSSFTLTCPYVAGSHQAKVGLQDEGSEKIDTVLATTIVSDITGCQEADGFPSATIDDSADDATTDTPGVSTDLSDDLKEFFPSVGIVKESTREAILILLLILIGIGYAASMQDSNYPIVPIIAIILYLGLLAFTLLGIMRPYVLIITTIMGIALASIYSGILGGRGNVP